VTTAREVAVQTLVACEKQGAWSDGHLKKLIRQAGLDRRDAALATRLCFGVQQNSLLLDFYLRHFSSVKPEKMEPAVRGALRIALYQILMMDKIPASAAVNESVAIARKLSRNPRSAGLVNAILRAFLRAQEELPAVEGKTVAETLSLRYSHPLWLVEEWITRLGEEGTEALLKADNDQPPTTAQVNLTRTDTDRLIVSLEEQEVETEPHPWLADCLTLSNTGDLEHLEAFAKGEFYIQDVAARLAVEAAGVEAGQRILDCCGAPGGKSFAAAIRMKNRGEIITCDIHPHKVKLIEVGAQRLGLDIIRAKEQNAREFVPEWEQGFDTVLADVPCSGLGIIRKKPDIRYKDPKPLDGLPAVQKGILENVSRYVRPGGVLLYSTCTLRHRENEGAVEEFLAGHGDFTLEPFELPVPVGGTQGMVTLWPHIHGTDGFFIAKLRRKP